MFAVQLQAIKPMPIRSRLHETGHIRNGRGARAENSRSWKGKSTTVVCAVVSADRLPLQQKSAEDSGHYSARKATRGRVRTPKLREVETALRRLSHAVLLVCDASSLRFFVMRAI